ncbi:MAG: carboxypeptidase-like regulatory domain-containing protein [Duncaniella sp.]|nr:carboxypeptidase-like regulatory domain-containing protein [Duncaniella sp.]
MKSLLSAILIFLSLAVATVSVDAVIVRGTVVDAETGEPLVGACVLKKVGDSIYRESRCLTDIDGDFSMNVPLNVTLEFSLEFFSSVNIVIDSVYKEDSILIVTLPFDEIKLQKYIESHKRNRPRPLWLVDGVKLEDSIFAIDAERLESKYAKKLVCRWLSQLSPDMIQEINIKYGSMHWDYAVYYSRDEIEILTTHRDIPFIVNGDTIIAKDAGMGIFFNRKALMDYITIHAADFGITTPVDTIIPSTTPVPQVVVFTQK